MMMSTRFSLHVFLLAVIGLLPVARNHYLPNETDQRCAEMAMPVPSATQRVWPEEPPWLSEAFDTDDWAVRRVIDDSGSEIVLYVVRSFDWKRLYHHPELAIAHGHDLRYSGVSRLREAPEVPLHTLRGQANGVAVYSLVYDEVPIAEPIREQLYLGLKVLFRPRRPMTLVFGLRRNAPAHDELTAETLAGHVVRTTLFFLTPVQRGESKLSGKR